jgi:uncharacterized protein YcaQ
VLTVVHDRAMPLALDHLRRHAIARSLATPTTLARAVDRLGFVQADPIRAPARAQDLTLRHRVQGYRAGDLERHYPRLGIEEDFFVNYGFLPRGIAQLMHPRAGLPRWPRKRAAQAAAVLEFVRERGIVHPREVDAQFAHGRTRNWFGGSSRASTQLLDAMHYRGLLRVARRESGTRLYAVRELHAPSTDPVVALDGLVEVIVRKYAPLPKRSLSELVGRLRHAAPQWAARRRGALERACARLPHATVGGVEWYWPEGEDPSIPGAAPEDDRVRLLAPFDPLVWDRRRFELFWGWAYRFEAYVPAPRRVRGYYALPLLWRGEAIGWANLAQREDALEAGFGYVRGSPPRAASFRRALAEEVQGIREFLGLRTPTV